MPKRTADARWTGSLREGSGNIALASGAYDGPYTFKSRFEEGDGTNPEEMIAGAHAGCFTMALSLILGEAGHEPDSIRTHAKVSMAPHAGGFKISRIDLTTVGKVPGIDADQFAEFAETAKDNCPVSMALAAVDEITLDVSFEE